MSSCPKNLKATTDNKYILLGEPLGDGISSEVYKALDSLTGKEYALKLFKKNYDNSDEIKINKIISQFDNPSFIKCIDHSKEYIVFELCKGDIFKYVEKLKNDKLIKFIIFKILKAVQFLHQKGICHRDLKTENIFLANDYSLKIGDFGQSISFLNENNQKIFLKESCGTQRYKAPEIIYNCAYNGEKIDIFSIGVIFFSIKFKIFPFAEATHGDKAYKCIIKKDKENFWKIVEGRLKQIPKFSKEFETLFFNMVSFQPIKRPTIEEILNESYMKEVSSLDDSCLKELEQNLNDEGGI